MFKTLFAAALLACMSATGALALACGPNDKVIQIEPNGFVPDVQYFCDGQGVLLYNNSGYDLTFSYLDSSGNKQTIATFSKNSTIGTFRWASSITDIYYTSNKKKVYLNNASIRVGFAPETY